jgi:hypothetical protein
MQEWFVRTRTKAEYTIGYSFPTNDMISLSGMAMKGQALNDLQFLSDAGWQSGSNGKLYKGLSARGADGRFALGYLRQGTSISLSELTISNAPKNIQSLYKLGRIFSGAGNLGTGIGMFMDYNNHENGKMEDWRFSHRITYSSLSFFPGGAYFSLAGTMTEPIVEVTGKAVGTMNFSYSNFPIGFFNWITNTSQNGYPPAKKQ